MKIGASGPLGRGLHCSFRRRRFVAEDFETESIEEIVVLQDLEVVDHHQVLDPAHSRLHPTRDILDPSRWHLNHDHSHRRGPLLAETPGGANPMDGSVRYELDVAVH